VTVDVRVCTAKAVCVESTDCKLSDWSPWGNCLRDCFGVQEKTRRILQYARGFYGKPCENATLKIIQPCNPAIGAAVPDQCKIGPKSVDCKLGHWGAWSKCSMDCGPGQKQRVRGIDEFPESNGKPCNAGLKETDSCELKKCDAPKCIDCLWNDWGEWGQCMGKCNGQKYRHRNIKQLANWCGNNCSLESAVETTRCKGACLNITYCTWSQWSTTAECDADACGPVTKRVRRSLHIVDEIPSGWAAPISNGTKYQTCHGSERSVSACSSKSCEPPKVDCAFDHWSDWSAPSCSQLCERTRNIGRMNRHGGSPCSGPIRATKVCHLNCEQPVDCVLATWTTWSTCAADNGQTYRTRDISQMMQFGGKLCTGNLQETKWCTEVKTPVDCKMAQWAPWSHCTVTCGGGSQSRKRSIDVQVAHGGNPCNSSTEELQSCHNHVCPEHGKPVNCELNHWTDWKGDVHTAQKQRDRTIKTQPMYGGQACNGNMQEVRPIDPVDCKVSPWGSWDTCDRECENGQQQRKRQVDEHPRFGGKQCTYPLSLLEVQGCHGDGKDCAKTGKQDAQVTHWTAWSHCTASCGPGQQTRSRDMRKDRGALGVGFTGELKQTRQCQDVQPCATTDCVWHLWSHWSACSKICAGGEQTRGRDIKTAPQHRGKACDPLSGEEVQACNLQSCNTGKCKDGEWNPWSAWGACSSSCLGGVQYRHRTVKQYANFCGQAVKGDDREYQSCNHDKACFDTNCTFGKWEPWGACTAECDGVTRRQRVIQTMGSGAGASCEGSLSDIKTCNPSSTTKGCTPVVKKDCVWNAFSASDCSATCGRGDIYKKRTIKVHAAFGGAPCVGNETVVEPCKDLDPCPKPKAIDCKWATWSDWSACSKCGGQRKRFRDIKAAPQYGGQKCVATETSQTEGCLGKEYCTKTFCVWQSWGDWGACSRKCDTGRRKRRRQLKETSEAPADHGDSNAQRLYNTYQELQEQIAEKSQERWQDLALAFSGGCLSFIVLASAIRFGAMRMRSRDSNIAAPRQLLSSAEQRLAPHDHRVGPPRVQGYSPLGQIGQDAPIE
jgi:hypothetical protein